MEEKNKIFSIKEILFGIFFGLFVFIFTQIGSVILTDALPLSEHTKSIFMFIIGVSFITISITLYIKYILKSSLDDFYIKKSESNLLIWLCAGFLMVGYVFSSAKFLGLLKYSNTLSYPLYLIILNILLIGVMPGYIEELVFRGLIFNLLKNKVKLISAMIIPSLVFAVFHLLGTKDMDLISFILLIIGGTTVGVLFSCIAYISKSIVPSTIVHSIWNIFVGSNKIQTFSSLQSISIYEVNSSNILLDGGVIGYQASIPIIFMYLLVDAILLTYIYKQK